MEINFIGAFTMARRDQTGHMTRSEW